MKFYAFCFVLVILLPCSPVLRPSKASADQQKIYVPPVPGMPVFEIGPIQIDTTKRFDPQVVVQWRMTQLQKRTPTVMAITGDRRLNLILTDVGSKPFGTLKFDYKGSLQKPLEVAVWFEIHQERAGTCLVSNVQTLGKIDPQQLPQLAAAQEAADFAAEKVKRAPPKEVPPGFVPLTSAHRVVPGMPIKAAYHNEWFDAEVLAIDSRGWISAQYDDPENTIRMLPTFPPNQSAWFAADPKTIATIRKSPRRYRPSKNVLPGTMAIVPDGFVPVPAIPLPPGLPVKFAFATIFQDGLVLRSDANQVEIQIDWAGQVTNRTIPRGQIVVSKQDAKRAASRTAKRIFAANLNKPSDDN